MKNYLKKFFSSTAAALVLSIFIGTQPALAMCIPFLPPGRTFEPARNIKTLVVFDGKRQTMVVQPQFSGDAKQFGLVMVAPSQPTIEEAPEDVFDELEDLTNPAQDLPVILEDCPNCGAVEPQARKGVKVIEKRAVGDYESVVLKADSDKELLKWLINNDYAVSDENRTVIDRYVSKDSYFIALKVNFDKVKVDSAGNLNGELNPIAFTYNSSRITLPTRLMAPVEQRDETDDKDNSTEDAKFFAEPDPDATRPVIWPPDNSYFNMTVYVLAPEPYYVPGAAVQFSKILTLNDVTEAPSLGNYNAWKRWLVRSQFNLDVEAVEQDLTLKRGVNEMIVETGDTALKVNPHLIPDGSGIVEADNASTKYFTEPDHPVEYSRGIPIKTIVALSVVVLVGSLIGWVTYRKQRGQAALPELPKHLKSRMTLSDSLGAGLFGFGLAVSLALGTLVLIYFSELLPSDMSQGNPLIVLITILYAAVLVSFLATFGFVIHIRTIIKHGWRAFFISAGIEIVSLLVILTTLIKALEA